MDIAVTALLTVLGICIGALATLFTARLSTRGLRQLAADDAAQRKLEAQLAMLRELRINQLLLDDAPDPNLPIPLLTNALGSYILNESNDEIAAPVAKTIRHMVAYNAALGSEMPVMRQAPHGAPSPNAVAIQQLRATLGQHLEAAISHLQTELDYHDIVRAKQQHDRQQAGQSLKLTGR